MSPKDCAYIVEHLSVRFMAMVADHSRQLAEHRAAFGARTEADAKIIAGLRSEIVAAQMAVLERDSLMSERDGLLTQVQDMRVEITRITGNHDLLRREYDKALTLCETDEQTPAECIGSLNARIDRLQDDARSDAMVREDLHRINVELRADVAALQERLRASIARGDFAQMEVAALKSQTPKHPVKVGEWVKRLTPSPMTPAGGVAKVTDVFEVLGLAVKIERPDGIKGTWWAKSCEPCDPPEATHDTEEGKAVAESAVRTEPVAEEIKVGDVVEVVSNTGLNTWLADVGSFGTVTSIETLEDSLSVRLKNVPDKKNVCGGYVSICDVRKVTT